jgi:hypothetical protein
MSNFLFANVKCADSADASFMSKMAFKDQNMIILKLFYPCSF